MMATHSDGFGFKDVLVLQSCTESWSTASFVQYVISIKAKAFSHVS